MTQNSSSTTKNNNTLPSLKRCQSHSFFDYYLTYENQRAWHNLYNNNKLIQAFAEHWTAKIADDAQLTSLYMTAYVHRNSKSRFFDSYPF
mmetsp:Transcript_12046/g.18080  ORF Transcript_12046/g.18080 Transcript_12046/m.18080 type:complete len:90 (-) Transcript_12046:925-1194(-)